MHIKEESLFKFTHLHLKKGTQCKTIEPDIKTWPRVFSFNIKTLSVCIKFELLILIPCIHVNVDGVRRWKLSFDYFQNVSNYSLFVLGCIIT